MRKLFLLLFFLAATGEILSKFIEDDWLHHICKPLLMIFLGLYYSASVKIKGRSIFVLLALLFSFLGDSFLMYEDKDYMYFILGLGSFLVAHIFYCIVYNQHRNNVASNPLHGIHKLRLALPVILTGTGLVVVLFPHLDALKFPVMIYAMVMMVMVLNALFRYNRTTPFSFWMVFCGAALFMISDATLAINKFVTPLPAAGVMIMLTYILAQYFIIAGLLKHVSTKG